MTRSAVHPASQGYPLVTSEEGGVRFLHFGSEWVQGAMRLSDPFRLEAEYTRQMMAALLFAEDLGAIRTTLQIGLGAGSISKFLLRALPHAAHHVVEIDARVVRFAHERFALPADAPQLHLHVADGASWLRDAALRFDAILVDAFDEHASNQGTASDTFYRQLLAHLHPTGALAANLFGPHRSYDGPLRALTATFRQRVIALPRAASGNVVTLALGGDVPCPPAGTLADRARRLRDATGLGLVALSRHLRLPMNVQ